MRDRLVDVVVSISQCICVATRRRLSLESPGWLRFSRINGGASRVFPLVRRAFIPRGARIVVHGSSPIVEMSGTWSTQVEARDEPWFLLMLSDRIFDSSVDRAILSLPAAPDGPNTVCAVIHPFRWASPRFQRLTCHLPSRQKRSTVDQALPSCNGLPRTLFSRSGFGKSFRRL
jgi:hypothetical protein